MKNLIWGLFAFATLAHAQGTVTDIDGNTYDYLTYGTQQWTVENAAMETYRDGTPIPQITDATQWSSLTTGAWCYYDNDPTKGKLYNWYAVAGIHDNDPNTPNMEFAPEGWHVPSDAEWTSLEEHLIANGYNYDGTTTGNKIAKSMASTSDWLNSTNAGAPGNNQSLNNSSNFNVLPHGYRNLNGVFYEESYDGIVWSSTVDDPTHSWNRIIYSDQNSIIRNNGYSKSGSSVRFIQNSNTCSEASINASATEVCAGESVDLTVSSGLTAGTTACTSADLPANLQTGLVGYWPFCGNANDESGNGNNGTVNGATLTTDRFGNPNSAYSFDSVDDYLTIDSNNNQLDLYGNCCITISGWINIEDTNNQYGIFTNSGYNVNHQQYALKVDANNKLYFLSGNGLFEANGINYSTSSVESNQWTHTAVTYDGSTLKLYLNGNLEFENQIIDYFPESPSETVFIGNSWGANNELFPGDIDDLAVWNRALTPSEIQQLANPSTYTWSTGDTTETISVTPTETTEYWVDVTTNVVTCREYVTINVTAPAAPTGPLTQSFCDAATVADLAATGDNIQWYDAAVGGSLLASTSSLTNGQMVYASQTIDGCESTDRLEVTVSIQDITITASATEVCAGESVDLSVVGDINSTYLWSTGESNFSGQGTLIDEYSLTANIVSQNTFSIIPGNIYRLEVSGTISLGGGAGNQRDVAYFIQSGSDGTIEGTPFDSACNLRIWTSLFCDTPGLRPSPDIYDASTHTYNYPFTANSSTLDVGFWDSPLGDNGSNVVTFKLYELSNSESTITVTPTETTEYWVDVTTNGVTCREYVTITVNDLPEAPTGETVNYFINCDSFSPTLNDAIATLTGDNIKLYDAAVGGNLLDPNSNIIDGQVVYASQTLDSCESSDRLEVQLNLYTLDTPVTDAPNNTVSFCNEQNLTILDLAPAQTATDRLWYETATSTTPIAETTPLVDGVTYYVSNYDIETGCESDRLAMTVEINNPEAPTGDAVQSFCDNVTVSDLSASGSNIQWYDAATGGNILDPSSALSDGQLLYASQTQNGCESITRLEVSVEIDIIPDPILITTELEFCLAREATLADLEVDEQGFALEWYDSFSGGNMLPMDTLLEDGVSYYATLYDVASGCESLMRLEVVPTVIPCEVVIYNAISLNDNGINDYMVIENAEYFPDNSLEIYNRDGHLLYSQTQYGIGVNLFRGIANVSGIYGSTLSGDGPRLPTGSYLYVFKYFNPYEQQQYTLKGFLTINSN